VITKSQIRIESAHLTAPQTDVSIDGSVAFTGQAPLNLRAQGTVNLALARTISPDITSSGSLALNATMRGDWKTPDFSGRASIRSADIHFADFSNGLSRLPPNRAAARWMPAAS
jgi:autotransporter translocation and assembly factor TamB